MGEQLCHGTLVTLHISKEARFGCQLALGLVDPLEYENLNACEEGLPGHLSLAFLSVRKTDMRQFIIASQVPMRCEAFCLTPL